MWSHVQPTSSHLHSNMIAHSEDSHTFPISVHRDFLGIIGRHLSWCFQLQPVIHWHLSLLLYEFGVCAMNSFRMMGNFPDVLIELLQDISFSNSTSSSVTHSLFPMPVLRSIWPTRPVSWHQEAMHFAKDPVNVRGDSWSKIGQNPSVSLAVQPVTCCDFWVFALMHGLRCVP